MTLASRPRASYVICHASVAPLICSFIAVMRPSASRAMGLPTPAEQDERVALGHEDLLDRIGAEVARGRIEVVECLAQGAHTERLLAVHVAVRAVISRAADRGLQDESVRLGR